MILVEAMPESAPAASRPVFELAAILSLLLSILLRPLSSFASPTLASHAKRPNQLRLPTWVGSILTQIFECYTGFPHTRGRTKFNLAEKTYIFSHYLLLNALGGDYLRARLRQEHTSG